MAFWEKEEKQETKYEREVEKHEEIEEPEASQPTEFDIVKKKKLEKLLDDWIDNKITEEEYNEKKDKIMLLK